MKNNVIGLLCLAVAAFVSCQDAAYPAIDNLLYIGEASSAKVKAVTITSSGVNTSITVRLAKAVAEDVLVSLAVDEAGLEKYNGINETSFTVLPSDKFTMSMDVTIPAGSTSSAPVAITIPYFNANGVKYALPLRISSAHGGVEIAEASSSFIVVLEAPLIQNVPCMTYKNNGNCLPSDAWGYEFPNYTLEWWVNMSGFSVNNQAIINSGGSKELYIRFGDLVYASGNKYVYNFLQIKTMGAQFDTGNPIDGYGLTADTWYHFAISYDASKGTSLLYMNGRQVASLSAGDGAPMTIDRFQTVSSGQTYFKDKCQMCQIRMWKTTRSENQISANMYSSVDPSDKDLVLYLPMDEMVDGVFADITGNGHDLVVNSPSTVTFSEYTFSK